ncbi:MAG: UDP-N-acetylmuramate--L-alanine ligase [Acidimicrobiales bacterium]
MTWPEPSTRVHVVGVGGAGMSGVARLLVGAGCVVSGSDAAPSRELDELRAAGVAVFVGHSADHGADAEVVLWSPAVGRDNVELAAGRERGARMVDRAELLGELGRRFRVVGLTGTHGKTTATSMMAHVQAAAGRDAARLVGAPVPGLGANGHFGPDGLVLEVDESFGTFARLAPHALGLLNVEADHLDHYGSVAALEAAFVALVERTTGPVVAWVDDEGAARVARGARRGVDSVAEVAASTWRVSRVRVTREGSSFTLTGPGVALEVHLAVAGRHAVADAAVVAALGLADGLDATAVTAGLAAFRGVPRRFERRGSWRGVDIFEDYAHLPGEIRATLDALRSIGFARVTAVFQPHRVTRTLALGAAFAPAFDRADHVVITDLYLAGEPNPDAVTGEAVAGPLRERRGEDVVYASTFEEVAAALVALHDRSDVVVLLGAGDVARVIDHLPEALT